jgi:hypothetical protein
MFASRTSTAETGSTLAFAGPSTYPLHQTRGCYLRIRKKRIFKKNFSAQSCIAILDCARGEFDGRGTVGGFEGVGKIGGSAEETVPLSCCHVCFDVLADVCRVKAK